MISPDEGSSVFPAIPSYGNNSLKTVEEGNLIQLFFLVWNTVITESLLYRNTLVYLKFLFFFSTYICIFNFKRSPAARHLVSRLASHPRRALCEGVMAGQKSKDGTTVRHCWAWTSLWRTPGVARLHRSGPGAVLRRRPTTWRRSIRYHGYASRGDTGT